MTAWESIAAFTLPRWRLSRISDDCLEGMGIDRSYNPNIRDSPPKPSRVTFPNAGLRFSTQTQIMITSFLEMRSEYPGWA